MTFRIVKKNKKKLSEIILKYYALKLILIKSLRYLLNKKCLQVSVRPTKAFFQIFRTILAVAF